jgi:hypothetical protein
MADKIINTRIMLKIDTLENWQNESAGAGKGANYVLKKGEIGFAQVPTNDSAVKTANDTPTVLFKVGDGTTPFKNLKWGAAVAADVYAWAKKSSLDFNDLSNDFKTALRNYIEEYSDLDTNTIYQVIPGTGDDAGKLFFQSADGTAATPNWQTAYTIDLTSFGINVTAQEINNIAAASSITQQDINNWNNEIGAKELAEGNADDIEALQNQIAGLDMARVTAEEGYMIDYIEQSDGQVAAARRAITAGDIPALDASKITSGTFADARIASAATWNAKQDALSEAQLAAANSGITAAKVGNYDTHVADTDIHVTAAQKETWSGKQDALSEAQLAAANSGITAAKVGDYDAHVANTEIHVTAADKTAWNGKQDALTFMTAYSASNPVATQADIADIAGAMHFRGIVEGADAATALATITDPEAGDIAIYGTTEYVYNGSAWQILGDEGVYETQAHASQTYVPKTTEVNGHALSGDIDLTAADVGVVVDATNKSVTDGVSTISNIVSDANYVHTDNNYTTEEKTKLAGIEAGAQVNYIKSVDPADFSVDANGKLDLAAGMNLVTDAQITKITNISEGATKVEDSDTNGNIKVDNVEVQVYDDSALAARVTAAEGAITTLNGDSTVTNSVDNKIATALADVQDQIDNLEDALDDKVDKNGTDRLMTVAEGEKLAAIEAGAQVNVLEGVQMNGTDLPITAKKVNIVTNTAYDASTNKVATMSDISTDNLLQGVNEFILNCGTSDVVQG